ncbi:MAG: MFS transporter, partial [Clostridiales bacterium]|nr:MFS transporter [Clostridiales bacterium]
MKKTNYRLTFLSCYLGYIVQAVVVNLSPLFFIVFQSDFGISYGNLANLVLICFFVQLFIDFASIKLCDIINYHTLAVIANLLAAAGLICLGTLPMVMNHYAGIVIAVIISSIGSGFIEVIISPIVDAIPADSGNSSMSMLHSFYCWGQVITVLFSTIALAIIGKDNWYFIPICWAIIPLVNAILFIKAPLPEFVKKEERTPIKKLFSSKTFIIFIII